MKRAIITAKGEVQRVGYRDAVEKIARKLKITGFVENLRPYDVRIVAEGEDANVDQFIERIKIKKFSIDVESLEVSFKDFKGEFEYFGIKRGDWQEELGERLDAAGTLLYRNVELDERSVALNERSVALSERSVELGERSVALGEESVSIGKKMLEKQDTTLNVLTGMSEDIDVIREDIGEIKDALIIITGIREETKELREKYETLRRDVEEIKEMLRKRENVVK